MNAKLIYRTPGMLQLVELAGRTCYRSEAKITDSSAAGFVSRIVSRGHESVIEHSQIVIEVVGAPAETLLTALRLNRYITAYPTGEDGLYLAGNARMFKDLVRAGKEYLASTDDPRFAELIDQLLEQLYSLPQAFFVDFVNHGWMDAHRFTEEQTEEGTPTIVPRMIFSQKGQTVELLNLDTRFPELEGLPTTTQEGLVSCTLRVTTSRDSTHQEVRHRPAAYSQESQRYVDLQNQLQYVHPEEIPQDQRITVDFSGMDSMLGSEVHLTFDEMMQVTHRFYRALRAAGFVPEVARGILPNAMGTTIVITRTLANWRHYLQLRTEAGAQRPIRVRAQAILAELQAAGWLLDLNRTEK
ncbi:MAG: FAD-dependent thymidylate synthase [Firmicutes bacterium]|nr:FAD-dependent thymidylate synthase [Bacillota bacterium]